MDLTHDRLLEALSYDPETGVFRWRIRAAKNTHIGAVAGRVRPDKYCAIRLDNRSYYSHRLAWFYSYKTWPVRLLDHKNCDPGDNRLENLREADHSRNKANRAAPSNNTSGCKGVDWVPKLKRWRVRVQADGVPYHVGVYKTFEAAVDAHRVATLRYQGEFMWRKGSNKV